MSAVVLDSIFKRFGEKQVLTGTSLHLEKGSVFGLVGLNAAGKTTLIRIMLGLLKPDQGICSVLGFNPAKHEKVFYRRVGVLMEHNGFSGNLNAMQNLRFFATAKGISSVEFERYINKYWADTPVLKDSRKVKYLSRGQKVLCGVCRAFLGEPEVCFFDEPVAALDIEGYGHFCKLVWQAQERGTAFVISSHQLDTVEELCTTVGILEKGTITMIKGHKTVPELEEWVIKVQQSSEYQKIIEECSKASATYEDGYYHVMMGSDAENVVPEMVRRLVNAGAAVTEISPHRWGFRSSIEEFLLK